jgi:hypothetical protein
MPLWTCEQCGAQFPETTAAPAACPICEDERQYVNWKGQQWLTREVLTERHKIVWRDDLGLTGMAIDPGFAIGQRALIVKDAGGCVMWDCIPLATREAVDRVYGAWWAKNIEAGAKGAFDASVRRYLKAIAD